MRQLFTVGHSNLSIEAFIALLEQHGVTAIADVRSYPYSRYLPHFNQTSLKAALFHAGIRYVFLGRELGARPNDLSCYVDGKALYEKIAATELFAEGIQRVVKGAQSYKIALMCAEKDPLTCHRAILICQYLRNFHLDIQHILNNGELETHQHLENRLLIIHGLKPPELPEIIQLTLFSEHLSPAQSVNVQSSEEALKEAYKLQGEQIAYVEKKENNDEQTT